VVERWRGFALVLGDFHLVGFGRVLVCSGALCECRGCVRSGRGRSQCRAMEVEVGGTGTGEAEGAL
jgi:hypothetical protein